MIVPLMTVPLNPQNDVLPNDISPNDITPNNIFL
jgi:hypothetical protein